MYCVSRTIAFVLILAAAARATAADDEKPAQAGGKADKAALEKGFGEKLTGSTLVGTFSIVGAKNDKPTQPERYELESVKKLEGREDYWTFTARIKYGENDVKIPITLKVLWAGVTPMISMTDAAIPGLGTFTARVMFYGDRYAGTWQHGKVGGHMWGLIEKPEKPKPEAPQEK